MLTPEQLETMLVLQSTMNARVDENWLESRYPYLRAVVVEASEAIEHHGWKWWKKQHKDVEQLQMELIDIWHFLLSEILLRNDGQLAPAKAYCVDQLTGPGITVAIEFDGAQYQPDELDLLAMLELLTGVSTARRIELGLFSSIMQACGLSWAELYRQYVGKNVLNMFRQDYGYKEGTYLKEWHGREDNEYLVDILARLDDSAPTFRDEVYQGLKDAYPAD